MQTFTICYPDYNAFLRHLSIDMFAILPMFFYVISQLLVISNKLLTAIFVILPIFCIASVKISHDIRNTFSHLSVCFPSCSQIRRID